MSHLDDVLKLKTNSRVLHLDGGPQTVEIQDLMKCSTVSRSWPNLKLLESIDEKRPIIQYENGKQTGKGEKCLVAHYSQARKRASSVFSEAVLIARKNKKYDIQRGTEEIETIPRRIVLKNDNLCSAVKIVDITKSTPYLLLQRNLLQQQIWNAQTADDSSTDENANVEAAQNEDCNVVQSANVSMPTIRLSNQRAAQDVQAMKAIEDTVNSMMQETQIKRHHGIRRKQTAANHVKKTITNAARSLKPSRKKKTPISISTKFLWCLLYERSPCTSQSAVTRRMRSLGYEMGKAPHTGEWLAVGSNGFMAEMQRRKGDGIKLCCTCCLYVSCTLTLCTFDILCRGGRFGMQSQNEKEEILCADLRRSPARKNQETSSVGSRPTN